jgi:diketogulonate reductase-like aldo/keto reductase
MLDFPKIGQGIGAYKWDDSNQSLIKHAALNGLNFIDTAEDYDNGNSERVIGLAIKEIREKVILSSKFSPHNNSYSKVLKSLDNSLKRLNTDYLDIYQLHWPNPSVPIEETIEALNLLKTNGKIRYIGFGNLTLAELKSIYKLIKIDTFQIEYNLFDRSIEPDIYNFCLENKILIIGYSPLDQGYIADGNIKKYLIKLSKKYGKSLAQIALNWIVNKKNILPIPKFSTFEHFQEIYESDFKIDEDDFTYINDNVTPVNHIKPKLINVINEGQNNRKTYLTLNDAKLNKLEYVPSPIQLSEVISNNKDIKPIRLIKINDLQYNLIEGRIRFWAWVLAYGDEDPIPSYIRSF